jgi:protoporphyrinogen oxidase
VRWGEGCGFIQDDQGNSLWENVISAYMKEVRARHVHVLGGLASQAGAKANALCRGGSSSAALRRRKPMERRRSGARGDRREEG